MNEVNHALQRIARGAGIVFAGMHMEMKNAEIRHFY